MKKNTFLHTLQLGLGISIALNASPLQAQWSNPVNNNIWTLNSGNVGIGTSNPETKLHLNIDQPLGTNAGDFTALTRLQSSCSQNIAFINDFLYRDITGSDWLSASYMRGISIDESFFTPSTLRSWIKQNPFKEKIQFGSSGKTFMSVGNAVGIGTTEPTAKLTIEGKDDDTQLRLHAKINGTITSNLSLWACEPGISYEGTGIGYNVNGSPYYGRIDQSKASTFIRFLPDEFKIWFQDTGNNFIERLSVSRLGAFTINGSLSVTNGPNLFTYNGAADVILKYQDRGSGGRAMVHDVGNRLVLNYAGDFSGGTTIGTNTFFANSGYSYINSGNVGIGTPLPAAKLDVAGNLQITSNSVQGFINLNTTTGNPSIVSNAGLNLFSSTSNCDYYGAGSQVSIGQVNTTTGIGTLNVRQGNVAIGTNTDDPTGSLLTVNGKIHAKEVLVDLNTPLADYVFNSEYPLMPLHKVESYVKTNNRLPDMPSADEVKSKGLNMGEMQNKLLQKIEELTLYVIELEKQIDILKNR